MHTRILLIAGLCTFPLGCGSSSSNTRINAGGATFVDPIVQKWAAEYRKIKGVEIDYIKKGSGYGIAQVTAQTFDFDRMVADAGTMASESMGEAPRFIAFASLSMPPAALRAMIDDVTRAGGVIVLRGLPQNSAKVLTAALSKVVRPGEDLASVGIDPRLFRAFGIKAVPTYVVAGSDFDLCDGFDCTTAVPPHDRMSGNVSAAYALETFARGGGPGALIAAQHLARLERPAP